VLPLKEIPSRWVLVRMELLSLPLRNLELMLKNLVSSVCKLRCILLKQMMLKLGRRRKRLVNCLRSLTEPLFSSLRWIRDHLLPKMFKRCLDKIFEKEYQNFKHRPSEKDTNADSLSNKEYDRVHGLSGNNLNMSEMICS
jgi:hypothetical protein